MKDEQEKPWYYVRSGYVVMFIVAVFVLVSLLSCSAPARPFKTGVEVAPPAGCVDLRNRGGEC